jgi:copper homeostasis protein
MHPLSGFSPGSPFFRRREVSGDIIGDEIGPLITDHRIRLEIVACTAHDAAIAEYAGASRIELVSAISEGGLTPSIGAVVESKIQCDLPVVAMVRPRGGGFVYTYLEFQTMLRDAQSLIAAGADALVTGILTAEGEIDKFRMRQIVEIADDRPVVCHRAFDKTPDVSASLDALIEIGVRRVLTGGGAPTALEGAATIRQLITQSAGRIEILPGGGIRSSNVAAVLAATGADQIHLGPFRPQKDAYPGDESTYLALDEDEVAAVRNNVP